MSSTSGYGREGIADHFHHTDGEFQEIVEGFLCPICHRDLKSLEFLTQHFEKYHSEEQDALKTIFKDIFQKAKEKIKQNFDDSFSSGNRNNAVQVLEGSEFVNGRKIHIICDPLQEIGVMHSHFEYFNTIRRPWLERHASETNKLILRLQKLLKNMPKDAVMRKQHEQNVS